MMRTLLLISTIATTILFASCNDKNNGAKDQLEDARKLYIEKEYLLAEQKLDSLHKLFPKALNERKAALALLDSVRIDYQKQQIVIYDSLINGNQIAIEALKKQFVLQQNKEYQDKGFFVPKESATNGKIQATTLRSGVGEDGVLFLESVFVGHSKKHNKLKVSSKDGSSAETLAVNDDGLNYRFSTGEQQYEIIRFTGADENGVSRFISSNATQALTLTLEGQAKYTYNLSTHQKTAISKSHQLSTLITQTDSLKVEKEKAEIHISYVINKGIQINDSTQLNNTN